jgi:site-specific recombinase XerD
MSRPDRAHEDASPPPEGGALAPFEIAPPVRQDLAQLVQRFLRWFQFVRERSEHTIASYAFDLTTFTQFCARVGLEDPARIRLQMIEAYLAWLRHERRLVAATANRHRSALVTFFRYLAREGIVTANPADATVSLKVPRRLPKRLTLREREHVLTALAEDDTPMGRRDLAIVAISCLAGLRCEELVTLRLEHLDLEAGVLRVIGKGDKERELPVVARLADILRRYLAVRPTLLGCPVGEVYRRTPTSVWRIRYPDADGQDVRVNTHTYSRTAAVARLHREAPRVPDSPYVFVRAAPRRSHALQRGGRPLLTRSIFYVVRRRVTPLVGRPVSPHALRHTFASIMTERGAHPFILQRVMGHARLESTSVYIHLSTDALREEVERCL